MRGSGRDGIKKGGINDPVAQSIRNEQNRDAMPSKEEVEAEHQRFLSENGCEVCDESDPENLKAHPGPYLPSCSATQTPPLDQYEPDVFCHEHYRSPKTIWEANMFRRAWKESAVAVAFYECGRSSSLMNPNPRRIWSNSRSVETRMATRCTRRSSNLFNGATHHAPRYTLDAGAGLT